MAWIESHQELAQHPKTKKLARKLGVSLPAAVGHLHFLWWWAIDYAQDGELTKYDGHDIADACGWDSDPTQLIEALIDAGFLDDDGDCLYIHDWDEYAGRLLDKRKANTERKRKSRGSHARQTQDNKETDNGQPQDDRDGHGATKQNLTIPKHIADSDESGDTFSRFWLVYPKKQGKAAAEKKWRSLQKQGKIDIDYILERVQAYIAFIDRERNERKFNRQFMAGSTFVNGECWNDDWGDVKAISNADHEIELQRRMRDRNEQPAEWFFGSTGS